MKAPLPMALTGPELMAKTWTFDDLGLEHWAFDPRLRTLTTRAGGYPYEFDLDHFTSSAVVLDGICQIAGKAWATPAVVGEFVKALDFIIDPQGRLCAAARRNP